MPGLDQRTHFAHLPSAYVAQTLLRLMQFRLEAIDGNAWCSPPPWNPGKRHVSISICVAYSGDPFDVFASLGRVGRLEKNLRKPNSTAPGYSVPPEVLGN